VTRAENESSTLLWLRPGAKVPASRVRKFQRTKVPESECSRERKYQGAKVPPMVLSLLGAKVRGNESSIIRLLDALGFRVRRPIERCARPAGAYSTNYRSTAGEVVHVSSL